jgi:hypothetical protein
MFLFLEIYSIITKVYNSDGCKKNFLITFVSDFFRINQKSKNP